MIRTLISALFLSTFFVCISQEAESEINFESSELRDINLQEYNELPRFGYLYLHGLNEIPQNSSDRYEKTKAAQELIDNNQRNYRGFFALVERKFMSKVYNYLSTDKFAKRDHLDRARAYNFKAQSHVYKLAQTLLTKKSFEYYFINPNDQSAGWGNYQWGGNQNTIQEKITKFQEYSNKHLKSIADTANSIWPEDVGYGYVVTPITINNVYDVDSNGYWIRYAGDQIVKQLAGNASNSFNILIAKHGEERSTTDGLKNNLKFEYIPEKDFELAQKQNLGNNVLLKIPEISFSIDKRNNKTLYTVQKIKFTYMGFTPNYRTSSQGGAVTIGIAMEDSKIEFYKEDSLKTKIFEAFLN